MRVLVSALPRGAFPQHLCWARFGRRHGEHTAQHFHACHGQHLPDAIGQSPAPTTCHRLRWLKINYIYTYIKKRQPMKINLLMLHCLKYQWSKQTGLNNAAEAIYQLPWMLKHLPSAGCAVRRDDNGAALFPSAWRPDKGCLCSDDNASGQA